MFWGLTTLAKHVRRLEDVGDWDSLLADFDYKPRHPRNEKAHRSVGAMSELDNARRFYPLSQGAIITDDKDKIIAGAVYSKGMHPRRQPYFESFTPQYGDYELVSLFRHPRDILAKEPSKGAGLEALVTAMEDILRDPLAQRLVVVPGRGAEPFYKSHGFKRVGREYFLDMAPNAPVLALDRRSMVALVKKFRSGQI